MKNLKVKLIKKDKIKDLYKDWSIFAAKCYDTTITPGKTEGVGKHCHATGHYSGSRSTYFIFEIENVSRVTTAQLNRHSIGVVVNERSMRYVNFENAEITVPPSILEDTYTEEIFNDAALYCKEAYKKILERFNELGIKGEKATQDARYILPIGIQSAGTWAFDLEALEHFCNLRLCNRSQWEIRKIANEMKRQVIEVMPELKDKLVPNCKKLGYCPENSKQCEQFKNNILTKEDYDIIISCKEWKNLVSLIKASKELANNEFF